LDELFVQNQDELALADWLDELAVYGTPWRCHDAETAYHLSQVIKHWYLVKLAIEQSSPTAHHRGVR
jgi:hypothetical protein